MALDLASGPVSRINHGALLVYGRSVLVTSPDMNEKQKAFVREYLIDLNASQAAIRAGYSKRSAGAQAHDLLKNPEVSRAIEKKKTPVRNGPTSAKIAFCSNWHVLGSPMLAPC